MNEARCTKESGWSCRDSISLFKEMIKEDGNYAEHDTDHFENIQSTNYQTLRFKPPPPGGSIGEFNGRRSSLMLVFLP
jgi:hypothetical protein